MERTLTHTPRLARSLLRTIRPSSTAAPLLRSHSQSQSQSQSQPQSRRTLTTTAPLTQAASRPPRNRPAYPEKNIPIEETKADFAALDVLRNTAAPATSIDACTTDGFALNNQTRTSGCGLLLVGGEAFRWTPWTGAGGAAGAAKTKLLNAKGQWDVPAEAWGLLEVVWPKPDLLIIGTGPRVVPLSPQLKHYLNGLGIRLEVQDTRNAAAQFNLLATERGVQQVAAAMVPVGWRDV